MKKIFLTLFIILIINQLSAQDTIKNLVFEGAGIKGLAYAGSIAELQKLDKLKHLEKVGGTSAGAIIALTVALGYTPEEIEEIIFETNFAKFNQGKLGGFFRYRNHYGYYKSERFGKWLGKLIEAKTGNPNLTFAELRANHFYDLYCVATLMDEQKTIVYSIENQPNMQIKEAVRASMTIPLYFGAMFIDDDGKVYKKQNDSTHVVCDGGLLANFPIQIFDTIIDGKRVENLQTLGIRMDEEAQITLDHKRDKKLMYREIQSTKDFVGAFYKICLESSNRSSLTQKDWDRTVSVNSGHIGSRIKHLKESEKNMLIENGKKGVSEYFSRGL
jgi:NTE family protein